MRHVVEKHNVSWAKRRNDKKLLRFDIAMQRREVWDDEHKANLIAALLIGIPIESLLFEEDVDGVSHLVLDGKQRLTTILQYIGDEFALSEKCKIKEISGETLIGKKFSELSADLQERIMEYELSISVMRPLSVNDRELLFFMRNQAIPLTKVELSRVLMGTEVMDMLNPLAEHPFFAKTGLSSSKKKRYQDLQVVLECLILESGANLSFSGNDLMAFAELLRKGEYLAPVTNGTVKRTFDYLDNAIAKKSSELRKAHVANLYFVAKKAMADKVSGEDFYSWLVQFFKDIKGADNEYNNVNTSGLGKKASIQTRIRFMLEHYEKNIVRQASLV